jgi:hypothetical protein
VNEPKAIEPDRRAEKDARLEDAWRLNVATMKEVGAPLTGMAAAIDALLRQIDRARGQRSKPQMTDPDFPDDDGTRSIATEAYRLAERSYNKKQGKACFEDLLIRATIGLCRKSYLDD